MAHDLDAACACVAEHRPPVLEYQRHHRLPLYLGGDNEPGNLVWLCLAPESQVLMADGARRSIDSLVVGDLVMAVDGQPAPVSGVSKSWFDGDLVVADGLALTPDHPVFTASGWKRAGDLVRQEAVVSQPFSEGMESHVLTLILAEPQVADPVVEGVEVDVVNNLCLGEQPTERGLHHQPVLDHAAPGVPIPDGYNAVTPVVDVAPPLALRRSGDSVQCSQAAGVGTERVSLEPAAPARTDRAKRATALLTVGHYPRPLAAGGRALLGAGHVDPGSDGTGDFVLGAALDAGANAHRMVTPDVAGWHALDHVGSRAYSGWVYDITIPGYHAYFADDTLVHNCSTAHANVHELLRLMAKANALLSDHQLQALCDRPVSRYAAALARDGFTRWQAQVAAS